VSSNSIFIFAFNHIAVCIQKLLEIYRTYQIMKRKIQHDAINNQEDEDSSAYPIYYMSEENPDKKKNDLARKDINPLSTKDLENKKELAQSEHY
jgi:hypothetical protein